MTILVAKNGTLYADTLISAALDEINDFEHQLKIKIIGNLNMVYQNGEVEEQVVGFGLCGYVDHAINLSDLIAGRADKDGKLIIKPGVEPLIGKLDSIGPIFDCGLIYMTSSGKFFKVEQVDNGIKYGELVDEEINGATFEFNKLFELFNTNLKDINQNLLELILKVGVKSNKIIGVGGSISKLTFKDNRVKINTLPITISDEERGQIVNALKTSLYSRFRIPLETVEDDKVSIAVKQKHKLNKKTKSK